MGCDKEESANLGKITNYPTIKINGEMIVILNDGDTYTELGAVALAGTEVLPLVTEGKVDTSKPGVYEVDYSAKNSDGYPTTQTRTIIVLKNGPSAINLEGTFARNGANINNVTRISDRVYTCDNAGGLPSPYAPDDNRVTLKFYNLDDVQIYAPQQSDVSPTGLSARTNVGTIVSPNEFSWVLIASGVYGSAVRKFIRQ